MNKFQKGIRAVTNTLFALLVLMAFLGMICWSIMPVLSQYGFDEPFNPTGLTMGLGKLIFDPIKRSGNTMEKIVSRLSAIFRV
ncbi:MAG: hypothetical protein R2778_13760 [Saprospiraceae bacterium]